MDSLVGHLFKIAEIFLYIVPLLRKSFHRILTILHVASTLSIYLFTRKCWLNFEKIEFFCSTENRQGYSNDGERNYGAIDEPRVRYILVFLP